MGAKEAKMSEQDIDAAYARYDGDPRASGPDDMDAFRDAVRSIIPTPCGSEDDRFVVDRYALERAYYSGDVGHIAHALGIRD
jgi:hypothetical protein